MIVTTIKATAYSTSEAPSSDPSAANAVRPVWMRNHNTATTVAAIGITALACVVVGSIQLCQPAGKGRGALLVGNVLIVMATGVYGPSVMHEITAFLSESSTLLAGVVIGWTYLPAGVRAVPPPPPPPA